MPKPGSGPANRIVADLRAAIVEGRFRPGAKLPTVRDLAAQYGVSRTTAAKAVARLASEGCITTRYGSGAYVRDAPPVGSLGSQQEGGVSMTAEPHGRVRTPEEIRESLKEDRSPKNIRRALPPEDHALFDREYWHALDTAKRDYDLTLVHKFEQRWWWTAYQKADSEEYEETIRAAERAMEYLERGESPPGAVRWDDAVKAKMLERIERGK